MKSSVDLRIEELSLAAWPALQTIALDGWLLRFAEGYSRRSNSVNALYPSSLPLHEKVEACESLYALRKLPTLFKVLGRDEDKALDYYLAARGYEREAETRVMTLDLASFESSRADPVAMGSALDEAWIEGFCACSGTSASRGVMGRILGNLVCPVALASLTEGGETVACGYGAVDRGWVGLFDIVVREGRRGRGYGEAIVASIVASARELGAGRAYLQVVSGNVPAESLYAKLGFEEAYRYWYRRRA